MLIQHQLSSDAYLSQGAKRSSVDKITFDLARLIEAHEQERAGTLARDRAQPADNGIDREFAVEVIFEGEIQGLIDAGFALHPITPELAAAYLTADQIRALAEVPAVQAIRSPVRAMPVLETSLPQIRLDTVRTLNSPSPVRGPGLPPGAAPRGAGVTIGIIDDGVYVDVEALKSAGSTTIFRLWDQTFKYDAAGAAISLEGSSLAGTANEPKDETGAIVTHGLARTPVRLGSKLDYGIEFKAGQIDAAIAGSRPLPVSLSGTFTPGAPGHGTAVACVAAGHAAINGGSEGIAPDVRLIIVKSKFSNDEVRDAIDYIIAAANEAHAGDPVVINCSFGGHDEPHNGMGALAQIFDQAMASNSRVALVLAAANERNCNSHAAFQAKRDSTHKLWLYVWDDLPFLSLFCSFNAGIKMSCRVTNLVHDSGSHDVSIGGSKEEREHRVEIRKYPSALDPDRHFYIFISPLNPRKALLRGLWTLEFEVDAQSTEPTAFVHVWRSNPFNDTTATEFIPSPVSSEPVSPQDAARPQGIVALRARLRQKRPESWIRCTLSSGSSSRRPIVVAAYDAHTAPPALASEPSIAVFSSQGPDASNLMAGLYADYPGRVVKPDIAAPGVSVRASSVSRDAQQKVQQGLSEQSGTSLAAPHITGVLALMWAEQSSLTNVEIKRRLLATARGPIDTRLAVWTAHNPKAREELWGAGVVDAFEAVKAALTP